MPPVQSAILMLPVIRNGLVGRYGLVAKLAEGYHSNVRFRIEIPGLYLFVGFLSFLLALHTRGLGVRYMYVGKMGVLIPRPHNSRLTVPIGP